MRTGALLVSALLVLTSCGSSPSTDPTDTTTTTRQPITATPPVPTTQPPASTTTNTEPAQPAFSVAALGTQPDRALGSTNALGSGCAPGTDTLPDGVWFGWEQEWSEEWISLDLACLWDSPSGYAAANDSLRLRRVPVSPDVQVWRADRPFPFDQVLPPGQLEFTAPGLPETEGIWLFVNDGLVTEASFLTEPVRWRSQQTAWPALHPGCCDGGTTAPPSPPGPLPNEGWPADGFYALHLVDSAWAGDADGLRYVGAASSLDVVIQQWFACGDRPDLCPDYWDDDMVSTDYPAVQPIERTLPLDRDLTVVMRPISRESSIVGDGLAFKDMLFSFNEAVDTWIIGQRLTWDQWDELDDNPEFPFEILRFDPSDEWGPRGYRAPGGALITESGWWCALEMRDGRPILYIDAGQIAG